MSDTVRGTEVQKVLVLAPVGRDAAVAAAILGEAGIAAEICCDIEHLVERLAQGAGCVVLTQEAVQNADLHGMVAWLKAQPTWSDLPLILLTARGGGLEKNPIAARLMDALGNVSFLERPFHPATLLSLVRTALRSRRRQYEAAGQLEEILRREQELAASEARFRMLAENIPVLAWTADPDGALTWYNSRWYDYTGTTPEQMAGWGWQAVHDPKYLPFVVENWREALATGEPFEMVFPLRSRNGDFKPFLTRIIPIREGGKIIRWLGTNVDISAERAAEAGLRASEENLRLLNENLEQEVAERTEKLRLSEARLRAIFETSFQLQGLLDADGTLRDANPILLETIETKLADVVGEKFWDTPWFSATPGMKQVIRNAVRHAAAGQNVRHEISLNIKGAPRHYDFSIRPIRDEAGAVVALVPEAADITQKRQAEEALRQSQKMEAIGQLTGGIAHDFNNMLQGISGGVELMRKRLQAGRPEEAERYIDAALQGIARASALTHRLLAFSRRQSLAPKNVSLRELVDGMAGLMRQTVGPSVRLVLEVSEDCGNVNCDPNQLENALLNLAINARDAMAPHGGELSIRTSHVELGPGDLTGWANARPGGFVRLSVADTGVGMPEDVLRHAFEPFFTTKPAGEGTGLGLSQVFGFISQSKGVVQIDSRPGEGTEIKLYLPRQMEVAEHESPRRHTPAAIGLLAGATVLLVEDEDGIRDLAAETLRDLGCEVIEAPDGNVGLAILRNALAAEASRPDMLVTDVGLPGGLNGRQLADAARELWPKLPVLLITGYAGEAFGPHGELSNKMELLTKPFSLEKLAERVQMMLKAKTVAETRH